LSAGNVLSIEPGYYEDGAYGIRIENIAMVKEVPTKYSFGDKPFLGFEHVTMVPYCRNLITSTLLSEVERNWIDDYHADIYEKTKGFFADDPLTMTWLERETKPL
jgi:Xaa-Pro aminopeptidase